ncbi:hypothetical protein ACFVT1_24640 [Streptomyces sp. NPDC057963]|uniref:hypothetical protein n=1 Tax=Streptomyces sp. NPDC057963 TaxID=3346290 RepID=UPI0036EA40FD
MPASARKRTLCGAVLATALLLAATACGSGGGGDTVASAGGEKSAEGAPKLSAVEKSERYKDCMAEHGAPVLAGKAGEQADAPVPEQTVSPEKAKAAQDACKQYAPTATDDTPKPDAAWMAQMREYVKCLRENGYDAPDPDPETGRLGGHDGFNPNTPDMQKLMAAGEKCKARNPAMAPR